MRRRSSSTENFLVWVVLFVGPPLFVWGVAQLAINLIALPAVFGGLFERGGGKNFWEWFKTSVHASLYYTVGGMLSLPYFLFGPQIAIVAILMLGITDLLDMKRKLFIPALPRGKWPQAIASTLYIIGFLWFLIFSGTFQQVFAFNW